jgi:peptide/nickel transport system substrate-binding protein
VRYVKGKILVLGRNRFFHQWSAAAQPAGFPDRLEWRVDPKEDPKREVDAVAAGESDWTDARFGGPVAALEARFGSQLYRTPQESTQAVFLNTRIPPFNDVRVRRALAFAIDRRSAAADFPTDATITCQVLPPDFPGRRPYCPYTARPDTSGTWTQPDLARGLRLLRGAPRMTVTVWSLPNPSPGIRHVVAALKELHFPARLRVYSDLAHAGDYFGHVNNSRNRVQAAFWGWVASDVSAADFLIPLFSCASFIPASPNNENVAQFCDPSIDRLMNKAKQLQSSSQAAANALWAQVDRRIVDAAPWIPLVNPSWTDVVSRRAHHYQRSPVLGFFFDQMWVR